MGNYGSIIPADTANGSGVRVSIFLSGCSHHCEGCFNSELWDFNYGTPVTDIVINNILEMLKPTYIKGLSILGGEPFQNGSTLDICKAVKEAYPDKDIWVWTGYELKQIEESTLLDYIDVIVDGKFEKDLADPSLAFRGSSNQKIWIKDKNGRWNKVD